MSHDPSDGLVNYPYISIAGKTYARRMATETACRLMPEVAHASENHSHVTLVCGGDDFFVAH